MSLGTKFPVLFFNYEKGIAGVLNGQFAFDRCSAAFLESFRIKGLGKSQLYAEAGLLIGNAPYSYHFFGRGSFSKSFLLQVENTFQTMGLYEFLSDRSVQVFYSHNLGVIHFKTEKIKPEFVLVQNVGFGSLAHPERHGLFEFNTMEKGYYEGGLQINNLFRFNYFDMAWLGIGVGAFYRYGPYHLSEFIDNFALKASLRFSL